MKKFNISILLMLPLASGSYGQTIDATFDGVANGTNEGFTYLGNAQSLVAGGSWDAATGEVSMDTTVSGNGTMGIVSDVSFDGTALTEVTVTWEVASITDLDNGPTHNGMFLGIMGHNENLWNQSDTAANAGDQWAIGVRVGSGTANTAKNVIYASYDTSTVHRQVLSPTFGTITTASLQDGFTATMTMDAAGWTISLTGLEDDSAVPIEGGSGSWNADIDFSAVTSDSTVFVSSFYQQGAEADTVVEYASVSAPTAGGGPSGPALSVNNAGNGTQLEFRWESQAGKVYDLLSSIDPEADGNPATWTVVTDQGDIAADPPTNTLIINRPADATRFYAILERNAPPPPPVFSDDFESDQGWGTGIGGAHVGNTTWQLGPPDINFVDGPDTGANGSAACYGTDLDNNYEVGTDIWLRSPPIDLTGATSATLTFWHIFDINGDGDETGVVRVLRSSDDSVLAVVDTFGDEPLEFFLDWTEYSAELPAAALGETIRLEFHFMIDPAAGQLFPGWYIDDVMVEAE